jgi:hypothetical protein
MEVGSAVGGTTGVVNDCSVGNAVGLAVVQAVMIKINAIHGRMIFLIEYLGFSWLNLMQPDCWPRD